MRLLTKMKGNYTAPGGEIRVRWSAGAFVRVEEASWIEKSAENNKVDGRFLELLATLKAQGRNVGDKPGKSYAPSLMAALPGAGANRRGFEGAMQRLFAVNKIVVVKHGPPSRSISIIEAVAEAAT